MSKEIKAFKRIKTAWDAEGNGLQDWMDDNDINIVENGLKRLEAIDNANPSEALTYIDAFIEENNNDIKNQNNTGYDIDTQAKLVNYLEHKSFMLSIIKQALLKAQEPKKYLKWKDLEFGKTTHKLKAKMNGNLYRVEWYIDGMGSKVVCLDKYITNDYLIHSACIKDYNQQFFNDLHLERVEE